MGILLLVLGLEAALLVASWLARRRGWHGLAVELFVAGVTLAVTPAVALVLLALVGDRWGLAPARHWIAGSGAIIVPTVLLGRLAAAWLRPRRRGADHEE